MSWLSNGGFSGLVNILNEFGVAANSIPGIVAAVGGSSWSTSVKGDLVKITNVVDNPTEVTRLVTEMLEITGLPASVATEIKLLLGNNTPVVILTQLFPAIQAAIVQAGG